MCVCFLHWHQVPIQCLRALQSQQKITIETVGLRFGIRGCIQNLTIFQLTRPGLTVDGRKIPNNHLGCLWKTCKYWDFHYQPQQVFHANHSRSDWGFTPEGASISDSNFWGVLFLTLLMAIGGGNSNIFGIITTENWGRWIQFDFHIFCSDGLVVQPPTRWGSTVMALAA